MKVVLLSGELHVYFYKN